MPDDINYMDPQAFIDGGYLHEVNRLVLHPLGLALQVTTGGANGADGFTAHIWDYRDDPEGICFDESTLSDDKAGRVCAEVMARRAERIKRLGYVIQPVDVKALSTNSADPAERIRS